MRCDLPQQYLSHRSWPFLLLQHVEDTLVSWRLEWTVQTRPRPTLPSALAIHSGDGRLASQTVTCIMSIKATIWSFFYLILELKNESWHRMDEWCITERCFLMLKQDGFNFDQKYDKLIGAPFIKQDFLLFFWELYSTGMTPKQSTPTMI